MREQIVDTGGEDNTDYTIYIHDGRAHLDELLATTLYVIARGKAPTAIERLHPKEAATEWLTLVAQAVTASDD